MLATPLRRSGTGLFWATSGDAPATGTLLDVSVQLQACAPTPLQWRGEVVDCRDGELQLRFLAMPEALACALERHVFMQHRRSVAGARSPVHRGEKPAAPSYGAHRYGGGEGDACGAWERHGEGTRV